jgi:G3E family GTPase
MAQGTLRQPVAVWLLTGFLGAGKTTTLNHLLKDPLFEGANVTLLINEFGSMGVDGALVTPGNYSKFEINSGSIFCACTQAELLKALTTIAHDRHIDHLIVEATGIAQTCDIERILMLPALSGAFDVRGNLCIVDAENFIPTAAFMQAAVAQVRWADALLINKTDLVDATDLTQLQEVLSSLNRRAMQRCVTHGRLPSGVLGQLSHGPGQTQDADQRLEGIATVSIQSSCIIDRHAFFGTLRRLSREILRLKGNVRFAEGVCFVEKICLSVVEKQPCPSLGDDTAFTLIGWRISKEELIDAFTSCCLPGAAAEKAPGLTERAS